MLVRIGTFASSSVATGEGPTGGAATLIGSEADGVAIDFRDMTMIIRDTVTGANAFAGAPATKLTYTSPSTKWILNSAGLYVSGTTLRTEYDSSGVALGLRVEEARTNVVLHDRHMTNAAWTKTTCTAAKDQTGIDGSANSASSLTATAGNATCLQAITLGSSARFQTAFVKRITGSGVVEMTMDNGATWTAVTVTGAWTRVSIPSQTLANPTVGFRIVTNGDAIAVDFVQNENGAFATSPIATTTASVTRAIDNISIATTLLNYSTTLGSAYVGYTVIGLTANTKLFSLNTAGSSANVVELDQNTSTLARSTIITSSATQAQISVTTNATGTFNKLATSWKVNDVAVSANAGAVGTDTSATMPGALGTLCIGSRLGGSSTATTSWLRNVLYLPRDWSNAELQAVTT